MTPNEKEEYELRIKNMQSKIDYLREQRENLTTYAKKYEPLTDEQLMIALLMVDGEAKRLPIGFRSFAKAIEAAHGIMSDTDGK